MFRTTISTTPYTGNIADEYFTNITGESFGGSDRTFLSSIRALAGPRVKPSDHIDLKFLQFRMSADRVEGYGGDYEQIIRAVVGDGPDNPDELSDTLLIYTGSYYNASESEAVMKVFEEHFCDVFPDYYAETHIPTYFAKAKFKVLTFISTSKRATITFVDSPDIRKHHMVQAAATVMLPWIFVREPGQSGLDEDETALLQSLHKSTPDEYLAVLGKMAEKLNFREMQIRKLLQGYESSYERSQLETIKSQIDDINRRVEAYNIQIKEALQDRRDKMIIMLGLEQKIQEGDGESEIMEYFLASKKLLLEEVSGDRMRFIVKDYLTYWDEDYARKCVDNTDSIMYENLRGYSRTQAQRFLKALFADRTIKLRVCAAYDFYLFGNVQGVEDYHFPSDLVGYMPNPHIQHYACMGDFRPAINTLLQDNDWIGAFEQTIASAKSLSFYDGTVMNRFTSNLYNQSYAYTRCIELPDGSVVKVAEAIEWLEQQEGAENE